MKKNFTLVYLTISILYLELAFKLINKLNILDISTFFTCLCACIFATLICFINDFFNKKIKIILTSIVLLIFGIYFSAHTCLFNFYKFYFQLSSLSLFDQVASFASDGLKVIINNLPYILVYLIPFIAFLVYFKKFTNDKRNNIKLSIIILGFSLLFYLPFALDPYGYVNKIFASGNMIQVVNRNGVISGLFFDISKLISGDNNQIEIVDEEIIEVKEIEYEPNAFDIDFESLNNKTDSSDVVKLNNYIASRKPTYKNEYTSFFKGKNLILFMAESFNGIAVNKDLTPTLYKLVHSGFEFNNFYTPTNYSTIGGEFCELTGLFPDLGPMPNTLSIFRSDRNEYPMGIANLFKNEGYKAYAYHNSTYDFQDRNLYLKNLGFDNYNACGLGLEDEIECYHWPASDVDMIDATFDDYINDDSFIVFYASVSGHGPYVFDSKNNSIAPKYQEQLKEYFGDKLGSGENASMLMAYQAGQMELDKALEELINKLESSGKLNDTVIALVGDHHPYYLTDSMSINDYNKLSTYERDEYIELYHSNFILYNSAMETVTIDKVGSQLDVIPTIYNLFGLEYDSRLLMGNDLLSSTPSIAIMADNSWVSDYGKYYAISDTFEPSQDMSLGESYVQMMNKKIVNLQTISKMIMRNNYYKFVYENK